MQLDFNFCLLKVTLEVVIEARPSQARARGPMFWEAIFWSSGALPAGPGGQAVGGQAGGHRAVGAQQKRLQECPSFT